MSLEASHEGYLPVVISLLKLHLRSLWHTITGGGQREKSLLLWNDESDGDGWYLGKSKADMKHRHRDSEEKMEQEEDLVEWARNKKAEEGGSDTGDFGPEDYFDAATRRRERGEGDEEEDE